MFPQFKTPRNPMWLQRPHETTPGLTRAAPITGGRAQNQFPMCSLWARTYLQVEVLPRQWMVGPSSDSRLTKPRRESEANGPPGQRPARVSRGGPSRTQFVRLVDQAVVAMAGTDMINRAEPRACGYSRGSRRLNTEPEIPIPNRDRPCVKRSRAWLQKGAERRGWLPAGTAGNPPYGMSRGGGGTVGTT